MTVVQIGGGREFAEVSKVPHPWIYIQMPRCVAMNSYPMRLLILPPGKTHDMGNGKVSLKDKHLQSNETDMSCSKSSSLQTLSIEDMRQMHASGPILEL